MPDISSLSAEEKGNISMTQDGKNTVVRVTGVVSTNIEQVLLNASTKKAAKETIKRDFRIHNQSIESTQCPSEKGLCSENYPYCVSPIKKN